MDPLTDEPRDLGVVVGVDGSHIALDAVRWAATEAQLRGLPMQILHAAPYATRQHGALLRRAKGILARAYTVARQRRPDLVVSTQRTDEDPIRSLRDAARRAELLVVGLGGGNAQIEMLISSVALDVGAHLSCPVAVVRGPHGPRGNGQHDVVVGVDSPDADAAALTVACTDAQRHGDAVIVLHSGHSPLRDRLAGLDPEDVHARMAADLLEAVEPWVRRYRTVPVRVDVTTAQPAEALLRASAAARLVVVGTRGRPAPIRTLLGSTSRSLIRHSQTPVIVVDPATVRPSSPTEPDLPARPTR